MFKGFSKIFTTANLLYLLKGTLCSLGIATIALFCGLILGIIASSMKRSKSFLIRAIANIYVEVIRGTPQLLQILTIFAVIPSIYTAITGELLKINAYLIGAISLSINSGAYQTELIRSGINAVDKGQWEACKTLGLDNKLTLKKVILPQALKNIIPPIISEFITLIKDTSLISTIGAVELLKGAEVLGNKYYDIMTPYALAAVYYLVLTILISIIGKKIEKRLSLSD